MAKVLHGDAQGNQINVSEDNAQAYGLKGNDTIISDNKSDALLIGGGGDDSLIVMGGEATLSGGEGSDTFELNYSADKKLSAVIEDLDPSEDKIVVNFDGTTPPELSSVKSGNDVVWRDGDGNFNLTLKSVRDNDYFDGDASDEAWKVLELTNGEREELNLSPLTMSDDLTAGASIRAQEITELGTQGELNVYRHRRPNNEHFSTVLKKVYNNPIGENLEAGARSPEDVMEQWKSSTTHYDNIKNPDFKKLGAGYNYEDSDPTDQRWYWTQLFANSLRSPESVISESLLRASREVDTVSKFIELTEGDNTVENSDYGVTIKGTAQADSINNAGLNVSISGGADNDTIESSGSFSTVNAGKGNDSINFATSAINNVIEYATGDGNDTITGFHSGDTVSISGDEFTPATVGNDMVIAVGSDSIRLVDAKDLSMYILGTKSNLIIGTDDDDTIENEFDNATIRALGGNDRIVNYYDDASIDAGAGNDDINNYGDNVTINAGDGNNDIENQGFDVIINGGAGDDTVNNLESATIDVGDGNDYINNTGGDVLINAGNGDDNVFNLTSSVTINAGAGNDAINNEDTDVTIDAGDGDDWIGHNGFGQVAVNVSINGGSGNDRIIIENDSGFTINGGTGNDQISLRGGYAYEGYEEDELGDLIVYAAGDGNDTIWGFNSTTELSISGGEYTRYIVGNDLVFAVGEESITLVDARSFATYTPYGTGTKSNFINLTEGDDNYGNGIDEATVVALGGNDTIYNIADNVSINGGADDDSIFNGDDVYYGGSLVTMDGGAGNDYIYNDGNNATIRGGLDNDIIVITADAQNNLVEYTAGDGYDTLDGLKANDTLRIGGGTGTYSTQTSGDHFIVKVGTGRILLWNAASLSSSLYIEGIEEEPGEENNIIELTDASNTYSNTLESATILAYGENNSITNTGNNVTIDCYGVNSIDNAGNNAVIMVDNNNDSITNTSNNVAIYGYGGDDTIENSGSNSTINGGGGDDQISLLGGARNNLISYTAGLGNDTIWGFNSNNELSISGGEYTRYMVGNNLVFAVGEESITVVDAASLTAYTPYGKGSENKFVELTEDDDYFINSISNVKIDVFTGRQPIIAYIGSGATIDGKGGNDTLENFNSSVSINGGEGNDKIKNEGPFGGNLDSGFNVTINGGDGADTVDNDASQVTIQGGAGNDHIYNNGYTSNSSVSIDAGDGDDWIRNHDGNNITIDSGAGNDYVLNRDYTRGGGDNVSIKTGDGNDTIDNRGNTVTIDSGTGDDSISNYSKDVTILSGAGKDSIYNDGANVSILSGADDDFIDNSGSNVSIISGAGNDSISLSSGSENNFIQYNPGDGNDTIWGLDKDDKLQIGDGTATYSTSTVPSGDDVIVKVGENTITLKDFRENPEDIIIGESGSTGGNSGGGNGGNGGGSSGGSGNGGSNSGGNNGGSSTGGTSSSEGRGSDASGGRSATGSSGTSNSESGGRGSSSTSGKVITPSTETTETSSATQTSGTTSYQTNAEALQVETQQPEKITLSTPTYANNPSATEVVALIQNPSEGVSQLWGDEGDNTLFGSDSSDIFIGGKNQGKDTFLNVSSNDVVYLSDVTFNDLADVSKNSDMITFTFKTGNSVNIQSNEEVSGAVVLADSTWHFRHTT